MQTENSTIPYGYIYKITNKINGKPYVGQTIKTDINERWYRYKGLHCKQQPKIYNALLKYGVENFIFEIIDLSATDQKDLDALEDQYIIRFNSIKNGYNCIPGKSNGMIPLDIRSKISDTLRGHSVSELTRHKISIALSGRRLSEATRLKMSIGKMGKQKGIPKSEHTRLMMSEAAKRRFRQN